MDWKALIAVLRDRGWTQKLIATEVGCGQATISDLARGVTTDPAFSVGEALRELHRSERLPAEAPNALDKAG